MIAQDLERRSVAPPLADAEWLKLPGTLAVLAALNGDGVETRAVGGAVRNALLGLPSPRSTLPPRRNRRG